MDDNKQSIISVSVIDYIGKMDDGVALLLNLIINDELYEIGYWFNLDGKIKIVPEDKLLDKLNLKSIYDYNKLDDLLFIIHSSIPSADEIFSEFTD